MKNRKLLLQLFGINDIGGSDFFRQAYEESLDSNSEPVYDDVKDDVSEQMVEENVDDVDTSAVEEADPIVENEPIVDNQQPDVPSEVSPGLTKDDVAEMFSQFMANQPQQNVAPELSAEQQQAMELFNYLKANPDVVNVMKQADEQTQKVASTAFPSEMEKRLAELEQKSIDRDEKEAIEYYELQVDKLKNKYEDYDEDKVLEYAHENGFTGEDNLENAYLVLKARGELGTVQDNTVDTEALKAQIEAEVRAKLTAEIESNKTATNTTVNTVDGALKERMINLTPEQSKYAKVFGMTDEEYYDELVKK